MNEHVRVQATSTTTSKGQTTIPKQVRDALGIKDGTPLDWDLKDGELRVRARTRRLVDLAGILGNPLGRAVSVEEMNEAVLDEAAEQYRRTSR
jgi:AbrB family looped-hinge helix DNA binding protein